MRIKPDRLTICQFADFLAITGHAVNGVDDWPEDRQDGEIDALVGPFAIQHTSIDALPNQRGHDAMFSQVVDGIEREFNGKLGFSLQITFEFDAIEKGQDWAAFNRALRSWIAEHAHTLAEGKHSAQEIDGLPFLVNVIKGGLRSDGVFFARRASDDHTLAERMLRTVRRPGKTDKLSTLSRYRDLGKSTMLLFENHDIANMNESIVVDAFDTAFQEWPNEIDELWFIHRVGQTDMIISDLRRGKLWIFDAKSREITAESMNAASVRSPPIVGEPTLRKKHQCGK